jgi:hypothetical protein
MPVSWTIKGEAGKALDATTRTLESLAIDSARVDLKSLDTDQLTFSIAPKDVTSATIPELGQTVTLYRDGSKFFHGHVIDNPVSITAGEQSVSVVVAGPWWWLDRINLTSTKTDGTGATAERLSYVFGTTSSGVNLKTAIEALIDRAIALGAPMQRGSVATFFQVPRITLNQSTCAQALAELVRLVPDTMAAFDYSTSPPTLNITRRGTASVETFTVGSSAIEGISIHPVYEMKVDRVDLDYVTRDVQGRTQYVNQGSGTAATGRNLRLNISGPELDTFLPNDLFDSYQIQTANLSGTGFDSFIVSADSVLASAKKTSGLTSLPVVVADGVTYSYRDSWRYSSGGTCGPDPTSTLFTSKSNSLQFLDEQGNTVSTTGKKVVITDEPPEWVTKELGLTFEKIRIVGDVTYTRQDQAMSCTYGSDGPVVAEPAWAGTVNWYKSLGGYSGSGHVITKFYRFTVDAYLVNSTYSTLTTVYRPADYTFLTPPSGLAANLKSAQDFVPYAGTIDLTEQDVGAISYMGKVINISGSFSAYSAMKALVAGVSMDIKNGQTSIELGTPPRLDYRTFTDRIRRTPQDNIEYL